MSRDSFWSEFTVREASGIKEREKEEGGSEEEEGQTEKMWGKEEKEDETGISLVNLSNYMTWAQGYDLTINKLQFHSFRESTN